MLQQHHYDLANLRSPLTSSNTQVNSIITSWALTIETSHIHVNKNYLLQPTVSLSVMAKLIEWAYKVRTTEVSCLRQLGLPKEISRCTKQWHWFVDANDWVGRGQGRVPHNQSLSWHHHQTGSWSQEWMVWICVDRQSRNWYVQVWLAI